MSYFLIESLFNKLKSPNVSPFFIIFIIFSFDFISHFPDFIIKKQFPISPFLKIVVLSSMTKIVK